MRSTKFILTAVFAVATLLAIAQTAAPPSKAPGGTDPTGATVNPTPQSQLIRILTPVASQKLGSNVVSVRFELTTPAAYAGTPNFQVQLDGNDPVRTSTTEQTFTGLSAGAHTVTVTLVDANDTPVTGGRAAVQFVVATPPAGPTGAMSHQPHELQLAGMTFHQGSPDGRDLPGSSSPLPLISVIGFGVLLGGIISALRTR